MTKKRRPKPIEELVVRCIQFNELPKSVPEKPLLIHLRSGDSARVNWRYEGRGFGAVVSFYLELVDGELVMCRDGRALEVEVVEPEPLATIMSDDMGDDA
jgi:hypothetical protein